MEDPEESGTVQGGEAKMIATPTETTISATAPSPASAAPQISHGMETSFRSLLPATTVNGVTTAKNSGNISGISPGFHRGRYNTKFTYKDWISSHMQQHKSDSLALKLTDKKSPDKQKEAEALLQAVNTYVEVS